MVDSFSANRDQKAAENGISGWRCNSWWQGSDCLLYIDLLENIVTEREAVVHGNSGEGAEKMDIDINNTLPGVLLSDLSGNIFADRVPERYREGRTPLQALAKLDGEPFAAYQKVQDWYKLQDDL